MGRARNIQTSKSNSHVPFSWSFLLSQTITTRLTLNSWQKRPWPPFCCIKSIIGTLWETLTHHTILSPGHTAVPWPTTNQAMKLALFKPKENLWNCFWLLSISRKGSYCWIHSITWGGEDIMGHKWNSDWRSWFMGQSENLITMYL